MCVCVFVFVLFCFLEIPLMKKIFDCYCVRWVPFFLIKEGDVFRLTTFQVPGLRTTCNLHGFIAERGNKTRGSAREKAQIHHPHSVTVKCPQKIPDAPPFLKYKHKCGLISEEINKLLMI